MKNSIKLITWLVGGLFTFSSCTDLDVDLKSTYTEYPDSEIAKEAKMAGLYYGFGGALGRRYMEAALLSSDEFMAVTFGGNWYDGGNYIHSSLHASLPGDAHVDWAGDIPAAITKCNQAIFDLGGEDENNAEQEALIAPALAMRAFQNGLGHCDAMFLRKIHVHALQATRPMKENAPIMERYSSCVFG